MTISPPSDDPPGVGETEPPHPGDERLMRLFLRNEGVLRAYARTMVLDLDSVDDVLQDAYLTMFEKIGQLQDDAGFLPWGKVIVRFKCLSLSAKMRRSRPVLSEEVLKSLADFADESTSDDLAELRQAFERCLSELPIGQRELLLAPYAGDGRVKQLAEQAGKSAGALYMSLVRLREKLGQCVRLRLQKVGG